MNQELAQKLKYAGFPEVTRIAVELNLRRYRPMTPIDAASHPFLQELIVETGNIALWRAKLYSDIEYTKEVWFADIDLDSSIQLKHYADTDINRKNGYSTKPFLTGYIDTHLKYIVFGSTPEEAVANLWLELQKDDLLHL